MKLAIYMMFALALCFTHLATAQDDPAPDTAEPAASAAEDEGAKDAKPADDEAAKDAAPEGGEDAASADDETDKPPTDDGADPPDAEPADEDPVKKDPTEEDTTTKDDPPAPPADSPLKTVKEKTSYAIGVSIGRGLKRDGADVDAALIGQGLADALSDEDVLLSDDNIRALIVTFQNGLRGGADTPANRREQGVAFLEGNKEKEGVVVTKSGLQYKVLKEGDGPKPKATDRVLAHYRGTLVDGTEFDSSLDREPIEFALDGVIKGWTEALQLMKVGSKWQLFIPSELGYGENPRPGGKIKPGDALIFDVELLEIK